MTRRSSWWNRGRIESSLFSARKVASASVSWILGPQVRCRFRLQVGPQHIDSFPCFLPSAPSPAGSATRRAAGPRFRRLPSGTNRPLAHSGLESAPAAPRSCRDPSASRRPRAWSAPKSRNSISHTRCPSKRPLLGPTGLTGLPSSPLHGHFGSPLIQFNRHSCPHPQRNGSSIPLREPVTRLERNPIPIASRHCFHSLCSGRITKSG